jgi:hypothetical protein
LTRVIPRVREAFPVAEELMQDPWMGRCPTLPDILPIISQLIANFIYGAQQPFSENACVTSRYL